jgi:hypothetical protein
VAQEETAAAAVAATGATAGAKVEDEDAAASVTDGSDLGFYITPKASVFHKLFLETEGQPASDKVSEWVPLLEAGWVPLVWHQT